MKKLYLILTLILACVLLTGCMNSQTISGAGKASYAALADEMPAFVMPEIPPGGSNITVSYTVAPDAVSIVKSAIDGNNTNDFAQQYAVGIEGDIVVRPVPFIGGNDGLVITGTDAETGEAAVYAVMPYRDYFVMVSGFGTRADVIYNDVIAFLAGFTVES